MKNILTGLLLISIFTSFAQTTLFIEDFEGAADMDGYQLLNGSSQPITFGGSTTSYIKRDAINGLDLSQTVTGFTGNVIACENTDDYLPASIPFILFDDIAITGEVDLKLQLRFAASGVIWPGPYESSDNLLIEYTVLIYYTSMHLITCK